MGGIGDLRNGHRIRPWRALGGNAPFAGVEVVGRKGAGQHPPSPMSDPVQAYVCAQGIETPYLRVGRGPAVVLLGLQAADGDDSTGDGVGAVHSDRSPIGPWDLALLEGLSSHFRVIAPLVSPSGDGPAGEEGPGWLREFLEGLGLERPVMLGTPAFAPLLHSFLEAESERIAGVLLLPPGFASPSHQEPATSLCARILSLIPPAQTIP
jgi:hypothetical protein